MQKIEFLVWNGKQYVLNNHDWILDSINVNKATMQIFLQAKPEPPKEEKKPEGK